MSESIKQEQEREIWIVYQICYLELQKMIVSLNLQNKKQLKQELYEIYKDTIKSSG